MVKIPGFDELKKMGTSLIDSAKSVNVGETVDKLKSKVESLGGKKAAVVSSEPGSASAMIAAISASLDELIAVQALQASAIKKIQEQLAELNKIIEEKKNAT